MTRLCALLVLAAIAAPSLLIAGQAAAPPDPALIPVQQAIDAGKFDEAETAVRAYLDGHTDSADARYLFAYVLFKEAKAQASLGEYAAAAKLRAPNALDLLAIGSDYFLMEDYAAAGQRLAAAVALDPQNSLALYLLGRAQYNLQHFDEALPLFEKCVQLDPKNVVAADYLGLTRERLGRAVEAVAAYRAAIAADGEPPRHASPRLNLGVFLVEAGKPDEAIPLLESAVALTPDDPAARREAGKAYLHAGRWDQARSQLEAAVRLAPQNAPAHFLLSQAYAKLGLLDQARAETQTYAGLTGQKSSPSDLLSEARALVEANRFSEAEGLLRRYLDIHRASAEGHYLLGFVLFKQRKAKESLAAYTEAAQYRKPNAVELEAVAGDYVLLHDYADADKWFSLAREWDPANFQTCYLLGRNKYADNRFEEAIGVFLECLKLEPRNVKVEDNLGLAYEGLGRTDEALAAYRQAILWQGGTPGDPGPYIDLGSLLLSSGRGTEALDPLLKAVELGPNEMRAHRALGKAYLSLGELEKAQREFEKTVELAPDVAAPHYLLAQVYRRRGLDEKAKAESEQYRRLTALHSSEGEPGMGRMREEH